MSGQQAAAKLPIRHEDDGKRGAFVVERDGSELARMTYVHAGDTRIIIDHTEVSDALRGQGAGLQLVQAAVEWARSAKLKILATCPFAKATLDKHPELHDVLA
jgi:predicted GNAT family acetyltransferase